MCEKAATVVGRLGWLSPWIVLRRLRAVAIRRLTLSDSSGPALEAAIQRLDGLACAGCRRRRGEARRRRVSRTSFWAVFCSVSARFDVGRQVRLQMRRVEVRMEIGMGVWLGLGERMRIVRIVRWRVRLRWLSVLLWRSVGIMGVLLCRGSVGIMRRRPIRRILPRRRRVVHRQPPCAVGRAHDPVTGHRTLPNTNLHTVSPPNLVVAVTEPRPARARRLVLGRRHLHDNRHADGVAGRDVAVGLVGLGPSWRGRWSGWGRGVEPAASEACAGVAEAAGCGGR